MDQQQLKRWFKFQKTHRTVPPIDHMYKDDVLETTSFKVVIDHVENIDMVSGKQMAIKFLLNLYYPPENAFFGRTYESDILDLHQLQDGKTQIFEKQMAYFHVRVNGAISVVVEVMLFEKQEDVILKRSNIGWAQIPITSFTEHVVKHNLKRGSSRLLSTHFQPQYEASQYYVNLMLDHCKTFEAFKFLIPEACICGTGDEVIGLKELNIPPVGYQDLTLLPHKTIYVQNLVVMMPMSIETEMKLNVKRYREAKYKEEATEIDVQFTARRIVVGYHNGWTFNNTRGMNNSANLEDGQLIQQFIDGNSIDYRKMTFNGALDVNHVIQGGMLIVQLEYDASFLVKNIGRQNTRVYVGWFPLPPEDHKFEEDLILGPGKTIGGQILVDLSEFQQPVVVTGQIGGGQNFLKRADSIVEPDSNIAQSVVVNDSKLRDTMINNESKLGSESRPPVSQSKFFKTTNEKDVARAEEAQKLEKEIASGNEQIKVLERAIQKLTEERLVSQNQTSREYDRQLEELRAREERYQTLLTELQKQHKEEMQRTVQQYEELKKMMLELANTQSQYMNRGTLTNASLALLQEGQLYDQSELEKWRIIESMTSVPRKTFSKNNKSFAVEAQFGGKYISRADLALFAQMGIKGLINNESMEQEPQAKSLEIELHDKKTSSIITIQFLAFRPKQSMIAQYIDDNYQPESIYSQEVAIPTRLVFSINLFNFSLFTTEPIIYENGNEKRSFQQALRNDHPLILMREAFLKQGTGYKEPQFRFEIEPSQISFPNIYKWLCHYLWEKCLTVEIWDSDSLQLFGTVKVPLRQIMRQQKSSASMLRSVDIVSPNFKKIMGNLQLMIKHDGKQPLIQDFGDTATSKFQHMHHHSTTKRKVVSKTTLDAKSLLINEMMPNYELNGEEGQQFQQYDPNDRIKERIRRFKVQKVSDKSDDSSNMGITTNNFNSSLKNTNLNEVQRFKELKKGALVKSIVQEHLQEERIIYPIFGKTEIIPFEFRNPYKAGQTFNLVIDDPDYNICGVVEIGLIHQPSEWKYFVDHDNYPAPVEYNMITMKQNPGVYSFAQGVDESTTFLLKFIFFRDVDTSYTTIQRSEDVQATRGVNYIKKLTYPRSIGVYITLSDTGTSVSGTKIRVFPHNNVIDHYYRFNERDNHRVKLTFPALYSYTIPSSEQRPILYSTNQDVGVEWADDFQIVASLRVPEVRKQLDFNILAYSDSYFRELLANWQIVVNSLSGVSIEVPLGQVQQSKLTVPTDLAKQVRFYSSHPLTVWFPPPFDKNYMLTPGKINIININIRQFSEQLQRVLVNCVDVGSKELVFSWVLTITPTVPPVSQVFDVKCPRDQPKHFVFPYINRLSSDITLVFVSSHPDLLTLIDQKYVFKAQEKVDIHCRIQRNGEMQNAEIKVFVGDEEKTQQTYDCLLFRVQFVL